MRRYTVYNHLVPQSPFNLIVATFSLQTWRPNHRLVSGRAYGLTVAYGIKYIFTSMGAGIRAHVSGPLAGHYVTHTCIVGSRKAAARPAQGENHH